MNCSFASQESPCSSYGSITNVLPLDACKEDITPHLLGLGVTSKRGWRSEGIEITEKELILNRAGHFDLSQDRVATMTICLKHRRDLTVDWRGCKRLTCCYPSHKGQCKQVKDPRLVNYAVLKKIFALYNAVVPVGSSECLRITLKSFYPFYLVNYVCHKYQRKALGFRHVEYDYCVESAGIKLQI